MVRTIEDILGTDYLGMNDANAYAMDEAFETFPNYQPYDAIIPGVLCQPPLHADLVPGCFSPFAKKTQALPMVRNFRTRHGQRSRDEPHHLGRHGRRCAVPRQANR
jgi:hypothetical protein